MIIWLILVVRFILEVITVVGLFYGGMIQPTLLGKSSGILLSLFIILIWSMWGAPKAPFALSGYQKFCLEIVLYGLSAIVLGKFFGPSIGLFYSISVITSLAAMYAFHLQGK